jgi:hypothetical protein
MAIMGRGRPVCGKRLPARPPRDYLTTATTTEAGSVVASDAIRQRDEGEGHRFRAGGTDTRSR